MRSADELPCTIERAAIDAPESKELMTELWAEIDQLYGNETPSRVELVHSGWAKAIFVIARQAELAVGCGAVLPRSDGVAEVKRVFVRRGARRSGVARKIMQELERIARAEGFSEIWLETGLRQPGAIRLYESLRYKRFLVSVSTRRTR
ncbi:GNAT family N-acetyltransferase [soil metagenome]